MSEDSSLTIDPDRTATLPGKGHEARVVGNYRLLQRIGEGGMGEVWEAEQLQPVQRIVALKLIKRGMDSAQTLARFETERQALALMDHPAIAKVFDAGTTEHGRPYFVMEHVHGVPITEYCDRHRMSVRERLKLFIEVCEGIQHAHQKAVIHRDVKPSNILIAEQERRPVPKIIDFGVAKATAQRLTERTLFTELGQLIGTPEYMSPEQAELTGEDIDIRTDVYSLGVVLYELLAGALPFDPKVLRESGLIELQKRIREDEPPKPSSQVTRLSDTSTATAKNRRTTVPDLVKSLKGDLDWIVMKALEKDRNRRYGTAHGLAEDLDRYLTDQAVLARPPSLGYRASKFVRRNKLGVASAGLVLLALVAGVLLAVIGMNRARQAEGLALQEAETAKQVIEFLISTFKVSNPSEARGSTITAKDLLDQGAARIESLAEQPLVQARLMHTMAEVYLNLELFEQALPLLKRALHIRREQYGEVHEEVAETLFLLGAVQWRTGKIEAAQENWESVLRIREQVFRPTHPKIAESLNSLAIYESQTGDFPAARELWEESLALYEEEFGTEHESVADKHLNLGGLAMDTGDLVEARRRFERSIEIQRQVLPPDHPDLATSANWLGNALMKAGDYDQAELWLTEALRIDEKVRGADHIRTAYTLTALGTLRFHLGDYETSEALNRRALAIREHAWGPDHFEVGYSLNRLGIVLDYVGRSAEARPLFERSLSILENTFGSDHTEVGYVLTNLGSSLTHLGEFDAARPLLQRALALHEQNLGAEHLELVWALNGQAALFEATGEQDRALPLLERGLAIREAGLGPEHPLAAHSSRRLAVLLTKMGDFERAEELLASAVLIEESKLGKQHPETANTRAAYAALYKAWGKPETATDDGPQVRNN